MNKTFKLPGTIEELHLLPKVKKPEAVKLEKASKVVHPQNILTTGVTVENMEKALDHLYEFTTRKKSSFNYAFVMEEDDGSLTLVERVGMPCWGAIREYHCGSRPNDLWPSDLREPRHIFPKTGKPVAISFQFYWSNVYPSNMPLWNKFITDFAFNAEVSPWKSVLKDFELTLNGEQIVGVVFKDTKIDPTVLVSLMRNCGMGMDNQVYLRMKYEGSLALQYLAARGGDTYGFSPRIVIDRFVEGNPFDFSNGRTFYERESYNRPDIDYVFGGKGNVGEVFLGRSYDELVALYEETKQKAA